MFNNCWTAMDLVNRTTTNEMGAAEAGGGRPEFLDIRSRNFFGQYVRSLNGRYTLAWRDASDDGSRGGARDSGEGRYLLLDNGSVVVDGRMERPNGGKVANNGTFVFNDWQFLTGALRGTFYAFRVDGSEIVKRRYEANLYNNGLSSEGGCACCQTCVSPAENDSSVLTTYDLDKGVEVARWQPVSGWATGYDFSLDRQFITLLYREGPPLQYTMTGEFVDRELWMQTGIDRGDLHVISLVLRQTHPKPRGDFARRLIAGLDNALNALQSTDRRTRAWALKLKAICLDGIEDSSGTLACYEAALSLDPKIGAKRRVDQLRKKLHSS